MPVLIVIWPLQLMSSAVLQVEPLRDSEIFHLPVFPDKGMMRLTTGHVGGPSLASSRLGKRAMFE